MMWRYSLKKGDCSKCCLFNQARVDAMAALLGSCSYVAVKKTHPDLEKTPHPWQDWDIDPCYFSWDDERDVERERREAKKAGQCGDGKCYAREPKTRCTKTLDWIAESPQP